MNTVVSALKILLLCTFGFTASLYSKSFDLVVYGGTSAGIATAVEASRLGKSVVLIEPTSRIGGLSTGGLGQTDIGNKQAIGGIAREFYQGIRKYYNDPENWKWQKQSEYKDGGQTRTEKDEDTKWTFEPKAALNMFDALLAGTDVVVVRNQRLNRDRGVILQHGRIQSITMDSGESYRGSVFVDATYEGDLMAAAGVSYAVGRESSDQYGETLNGVQPNHFYPTLRRRLSTNGGNHNFMPQVDPFRIPGNPSSGLLPYIVEGGKPGVQGQGDRGIQAYCFRMTLTDHPENRIPFVKPEDYNELNYELLFRNYEAGYDRIPWINSAMPNRKTDTNNCDGFSTDFIGQNFDYPEASYEERDRIVEAHRSYQQGLMWTLANHPRIPAKIRAEVSRWGTCKDEYEREDGWQQQLYIREARRMISEVVMTQHHCEGLETVEDSVGMGAYGMDSHHVQRFVDANGYVQNEGNVQAHVDSPYPISYRSIIPKRNECTNLIVPVCVSSSHIGFGSIRMEPVFMVLGQSAAVIAHLAMDQDVAVQDLDYGKLHDLLVSRGQRLFP